MPKIAKAARTALVARLGDETHGFNAAHAAIFANYGLPSAIAVNWTTSAPGAPNRQLYQSYHSPQQIMRNSTLKFPLVCIYATNWQNIDDEKFHKFAGIVMLNVDIHASFKSEAALSVAEDVLDSLDDALIESVNDQNWAEGNTAQVAYEGQAHGQHFPLLEGEGQSWLQTTRIQLKFAVYG